MCIFDPAVVGSVAQRCSWFLKNRGFSQHNPIVPRLTHRSISVSDLCISAAVIVGFGLRNTPVPTSKMIATLGCRILNSITGGTMDVRVLWRAEQRPNLSHSVSVYLSKKVPIKRLTRLPSTQNNIVFRVCPAPIDAHDRKVSSSSSISFLTESLAQDISTPFLANFIMSSFPNWQ